MMPSPAEKSPHAASQLADRAVYYQEDVTQATFAEIWRCAPNLPAIIVATVAKILRLRLLNRLGFVPEITSFDEVGDLPRPIKEKLGGAIADCKKYGFTPQFARTVPVLGNHEGAAVYLTHREGRVLAAAGYFRSLSVEDVLIVLVSRLSDDRFVTTSNTRKHVNAPRNHLTGSCVGASAGELLEYHQSRLREIGDAYPRALVDASWRQCVMDSSKELFEFHVRRGLWTPMSPSEVERLRASARSPQ
jgi:hypothetical protein